MARKLVGGSLSFDHAADVYDATRAFPDHVATKLTDALLAEIAAAGAGHLLEIGVGTGRISRPLMERGVRVMGLDIAPRMLARLREQLAPQHTPPDLMVGDATQLPFASGSFRAVLAVHVLHLVSDWQRALDEIRRVLASGGVFIHHCTRYHGDNPWRPSVDKWNEMLAARNFVRRGRPADEQIESKLRSLGGSVRREVYAEDEERTAPSYFLNRTRNRVDSWSWEIPDDLFADCLPEYERWMLEHYGELDREHVQRVTYELEVWSFA